MKPHIWNTIQTPQICYKSNYDRSVTKDKLHENQNMLSAYISVPQRRTLVKKHSFYSAISSPFSFTQNSVATYTLFTDSTDSSPRPSFICYTVMQQAMRPEYGQSHNFPHPGRIAYCLAPNSRPLPTKALHTICGNNTSILSSS